LDDDFQKNYKAESRLSAIVSYFTLVAILISCLGLFGLATFSAEQRTKEIGIRKALGATPGSIISMIMMESVFITSFSGYLGLIAGTAVIGGINYMMIANNIESENFYNPQVNMAIGIGAVTLLIIAGAVAGLIPALQASRVNPVVALKDE